MNKWPIFICYRQADGKTAAARIFELLNDQAVQLPSEPGSEESQPSLDVYFDQAAPGVEDWTAVHEPYLKRARAIIVICTPGSKLNEGKNDWVHHEIDWWLENREMAPILVDPLGEDVRYVPGSIASRWPNAQRIGLIERDWEGLSDSERQGFDDRVRAQFLGAIVPSADNFYRQELEQEKERVARARRTRRVTGLLGVAFLAVLGVAGWVYYLKDIADRAALEAHAAQRLAQARVIEGQAARTQTEAGLLRILKRTAPDSYKDNISAWEKDFRRRANELSRRAREVIPPCEPIGGGTVYEGQMVMVELDELPANEAFFIYLSVIPGSNSSQENWAATVLDVFVGDSTKVMAGSDLDREHVKDLMASVAPEQQWGLVIGLGTPHVLTHRGHNYRLKQRSVHMHDDGDMVMGFDLCREAGNNVDLDGAAGVR